MTSAVPELDADRGLALTYVPAARRAAIGALWRLDAALGAVLADGREPLISQIKLVWWRESLEKLDRAPAPGEPLLQAVARDVLPGGVSGAELAAAEAAWAALLSPEQLGEADLQIYASARGGLLFRHSARLLGGQTSEALERAGEGWALVDLARRSGGSADRGAARAAAGERLSLQPRHWPPRLRPLGMLAALAARDLERGNGGWEAPGAPGRMLRMLRHRLTGR